MFLFSDIEDIMKEDNVEVDVDEGWKVIHLMFCFLGVLGKNSRI
jgi:hypothetical protein